MKNKIYLSGITYCKAIEAVKENIVPIAKYFDGLNFVINRGDENKGEIDLIELLDKNRGDGFIHVQDWIDRYDFSRNRYLLDPRVLDGDTLVIVDSLEKLDEDFAKISIPELSKFMESQNIDVIFLHGKTFMVRKNEGMSYVNAVHEQIHPIHRAVELTQIQGFEDSSKYFTNTRPEVRDGNHWVKDCHFLKYYCYSYIQCLMGAEGDDELFKKRVKLRSEFKTYCRENDIDFSPEGILLAWKFCDSLEGGMSRFSKFINEEKILNDVFRYHILGQKELRSDWNFGNMIKI